MFTKKSALYLSLITLLVLTACGGNKIETVQKPTPASTLSAAPSEDAVKVAVLAIRSAVSANAQYGPILTYLEEEIGRPFVFVPVGQDEQFSEVEKGKVDFTFNNPLAAVQISRLYDTQFLATLSRKNTGPEFSSLIVANSNSDIQTIEDLHGKQATCVDFQTAAAGCTFQIYHLLQQDFDPFTDFGEFTEMPSQDNIVLSILNGTIDVGFIRTGQLEKMEAEGKILSTDELRIIDQAEDEFHFPHTTQLYPEWPFAALSDTDPELAQAVQEALLNIPPDHPAMENAGAVGFVSNVDYSALDDLIVTLKLKSWDSEPISEQKSSSLPKRGGFSHYLGNRTN